MKGRDHDMLARAVRKLARAINKLADAAGGGQVTEADKQLLAAILAGSEAVTVKAEKFAAVLKALDEKTP